MKVFVSNEFYVWTNIQNISSNPQFFTNRISNRHRTYSTREKHRLDVIGTVFKRHFFVNGNNRRAATGDIHRKDGIYRSKIASCYLFFERVWSGCSDTGCKTSVHHCSFSAVVCSKPEYWCTNCLFTRNLTDLFLTGHRRVISTLRSIRLSLIHIWRCRRRG